MPIDQQYLDGIERKLGQHAPSLVAEYRCAAGDFRTRLDEGVELAGHSLRSWEAAVHYFRVSGDLTRTLSSAAFRRWAHAGRDLAEYSSVVAAAFFKASPKCVAYLDENQVVEWASLGQRLVPVDAFGAWQQALAPDHS